MIEVKFEIKGLDKLREAMRRSPELMINEVSKAVQKSALTVQSQAMRESPVNKQSGGGNLRQNIRASLINKTRAEVISKAPYSSYVEYGTGPHVITVKNKSVLANKRTGQFFGRTVHHPGTRLNPFMERALKLSQKKIEGFFRTAIDNVFKKLK